MSDIFDDEKLAQLKTLYDDRERPKAKSHSDAETKTGTFLLSLLLLAVPLVGQVVAVIWACGGVKSTNLRNLARAELILLGAVLALAAGLFFVLKPDFTAFFMLFQ